MKNQQAQGMWDLMAVALSGENGLLTGYASDVYECDRKAVGAIWAPDSKYLWLVRENGSHLSRLGVVGKPVEVEVALRSLARELEAQKHCIWLIETSTSGEASIRKVGREKALQWCAWRQYESKEGVVRLQGAVVAAVSVGQLRTAPGIWACDMDINAEASRPRRVDVLAAYCHGLELATKQLGLFVKVGPVRVNGQPIDDVAPVFEVEMVERASAPEAA